MQICRRLRAFTMAEVMTGLIVIAVITAAMTMKSGSSRQSIRREAERLAAYINSLMQNADRNRASFSLSFSAHSCTAGYSYHLEGKERLKEFNADPKFTLESNVNPFHYSVRDNKFAQGGTITVTETDSGDIKDMGKYYVIIAVMGGRVRTSPNPPKNWNMPDIDNTY